MIVGLDEQIEQSFIAMLCGGQCILGGVRGLARTKLVSSLAELLHLSSRRVLFTLELMRGDSAAAETSQQDIEIVERFFRFREVPRFGKIVLADEVNRMPPKPQFGLLGEIDQLHREDLTFETYVMLDALIECERARSGGVSPE